MSSVLDAYSFLNVLVFSVLSQMDASRLSRDCASTLCCTSGNPLFLSICTEEFLFLNKCQFSSWGYAFCTSKRMESYVCLHKATFLVEEWSLLPFKLLNFTVVHRLSTVSHCF